MKINKNELKTALEIVKPGLANKEIIEQSASFAFVKGRVVTFNNEISVSHPIEGLDIEGAIQAEELYKFLGKIKTEEIDIFIKEEEIILKSGRSTAGFTLMSKVLLPLDEELSEKGKWKPIPENLVKALDFSSMSCSTDMSNPKLTCVHVNNEEGYVESCDNYRITRYIVKDIPVHTFLIPATSVKTITKLKPIKIAEGKGWIHFKTEQNTIISCRILKETFVNTSQFFKSLKKGIKITLPETLEEVIEKAIIFVKGKQNGDEVIDINISNKKLTVESKSEKGWFKETLPITYDGEDISFPITPYLLQDILSETKDCILLDNLLFFKGTDWTYLTVHSAR